MLNTVTSNVRVLFFFIVHRPPPVSTLFPYTTLFRSIVDPADEIARGRPRCGRRSRDPAPHERKQTSEQDHRSEEHTSELQSRFDLVCRLLLEKKKKIDNYIVIK